MRPSHGRCGAAPACQGSSGPALGLDLAGPWPFMAGRLSVGDALIYEAAPVDPGAVGSANSAMRQMEDCHAVSVALRPPRCKGGRTYGFWHKTRAVAHSGPQ